MSDVNIHYKLSYENIFEALLALENKSEGIKKKLAAISMLIIVAVYTFLFWRTPENLTNMLIALLAIAIYLFIMVYIPWKRRKRAKKMSSVIGVYKVTLYEKGAIGGFNSEKVNFDKKTSAKETENVFVIKMFNNITYCIPKKQLDEKTNDQIRAILEKHISSFSFINTQKLR